MDSSRTAECGAAAARLLELRTELARAVEAGDETAAVEIRAKLDAFAGRRAGRETRG